eukprot:4980209-Prymnesium_polylepis.1
MLEAGWTQFRGEFFRRRVELASKEVRRNARSRELGRWQNWRLEFLSNRFNSFVLASSVLAGFAFTALVELDINEDVATGLITAGYGWMCVTAVARAPVRALPAACAADDVLRPTRAARVPRRRARAAGR